MKTTEKTDRHGSIVRTTGSDGNLADSNIKSNFDSLRACRLAILAIFLSFPRPRPFRGSRLHAAGHHSSSLFLSFAIHSDSEISTFRGKVPTTEHLVHHNAAVGGHIAPFFPSHRLTDYEMIVWAGAHSSKHDPLRMTEMKLKR